MSLSSCMDDVLRLTSEVKEHVAEAMRLCLLSDDQVASAHARITFLAVTVQRKQKRIDELLLLANQINAAPVLTRSSH